MPVRVSGRTALIAGLAISLAAVAGLSISLLNGVGSSSGRTEAAVAQQQFFGIAQGITRLDAEDLETMAATGVGTDRFLLDWEVVQPTRDGPYVWPDEQVGAVASHGIRLVPYLWGSPPWVAAAPQVPPVDSAEQEEAWQRFVKAAVARYGPGGSYWANGYRQQYGADATPLPFLSWQIWNEPNLEKFFSPGADLDQSVQRYARLLEISHDAITSQDPRGPGRPRRAARLRGRDGLGLPRRSVRGCPASSAISMPPPCTPTRPTSSSSSDRSTNSARR